MYVDTHTHFYDEWLLPDAEAAIQRALEAGVGKMIQADVDSRERPAMWEIGRRHPGVIYEMLGLYPGSVAQNWKEELDQVFALAKGDTRSLPGMTGSVVAIGEIGLDYHEGIEFVKEQKEVLRLQLELAASMNLPVNIHLRDAWEDLLAILADCKHLNLRGNLHCFTSSYEIFERANQYGDFSVGIGGVVTFKNASIARTLERIPLEKILLETDAPYLAPVPYRGRRNESAYLPYVAGKVAEIKGLADYISEIAGADQFEIVTHKYDGMAYTPLINLAKEETRKGELPPYEGDIEDLSQYDTVFIGGPVWWGTYPQVMFTFFKKHANDLKGKTVIPFTTHEGSGLANCVEDVREAFPGASVQQGFSIYGHDVRSGKNKVEKWLKGLGY